MKITCDIISDLIPSYIDDICTADSRRLIEEHIRTCEKCRQKIGYMADPINCPEISEDAEVKEPFLKIKKRNRIHVIAAVAITICILGSAMFAVQEVGVIHNYFYPRSEATIINEAGRSEWLTVNVSGEKYLNFSSVFYNKELINDANSSEKVAIMIYDEEGRVVMDSITIEPGETIN
ncbi:zf-HC2 domain-containing protein [Mediterraneibacter glycyrrhizinilyticus]|uniref:zf-HC2 domain-containing protein n=1 Tax=Mediterraneibacter glycyrrhizinilyticus TaxID=342942 RepID=UPI0025AAD31B|nr:zf-HC2 domain-containing protein [Mediterraneibacter glycyrrhizinilyticus]MDN0061516.1 zf-HC2 domain-containing protein [Mediterraneibacter glycyrrhizinilyticus]